MENEAKDEQASLQAQMDYSMKHFLFIADQRIKTFNFYVILLAASAGATLQLTTAYSPRAFVGLSLFHLLIAVVFFFIERRNLRLLEICQRALMRLEAKLGWPTASRLASVDNRRSSQCPLFSYRVAISVAIGAQILLSVMLLICVFVVNHPKGGVEKKASATPPNAAVTPAAVKSVIPKP